MRLAGLVVVLLLALAGPAASSDKRPAAAGLLTVTSARGKVVLQGQGPLVGQLDAGQLEIKDLTPTDRFSPLVLGVPRGRVVALRGKDVGFRVPGGRYRIVVRGEGISLSARGAGVVQLDGEPDTVGDTGTFAVDDAVAAPVPDEPTRVTFGSPDDTGGRVKPGGAESGARPTTP